MSQPHPLLPARLTSQPAHQTRPFRLLTPQGCDPAPFYLFDEIDAALDPQYR